MPEREERRAQAAKHLALMKGAFSTETEATVAAARVYEDGEGRELPIPEAVFETTETSVTTAFAPAALRDARGKTVVVDPASFTRPGGGYEDGSFRPKQLLTRQEFFKLIENFCTAAAFSPKAKDGALNGFADAGSISAWAKEAAQICVSYSYVQGTKLGNGTYLNPKDNASRQEAMTMFLRCYKTIQWFYDENVKSATVVVDQINLNVTVTSISKTMYVCQTGYINVRDSWTTGSTKVGELSYNAAVTVTGITTTTSDGHQWYRIKYNGITAYVRADLLADKKDSTVTPGGGSGSGSGGTVSGSGTASEIANFAMGFVGYSYVWGGSSPSTGFDCSGLMYYVLTQYGYSMKRVANDQMTQGTYVSRSDLQVGDLVFFGYSGYANHVGMYIGGGNFVHASTPSTGVRVNSLDESYYKTRFLCGRRII